MLRNLNQTKPRGRILGTPKSGVLGSLVPASGENGPAYTYNDLSLPADANKEISGYIVVWPAAGKLSATERMDFEFTDAPPGTYFFQYQLAVDGVDQGSPATETLIVGGGATTIAAIVGDAVAAGLVASLPAPVVAQIGVAVANGLTASITIATNTNITALVGSATAAGTNAQIGQGAAISCTAATATASGLTGAVSIGSYVRAPAGSGYVPKRHECGCRPFVTQRNHR